MENGKLRFKFIREQVFQKMSFYLKFLRVCGYEFFDSLPKESSNGKM